MLTVECGCYVGRIYQSVSGLSNCIREWSGETRPPWTKARGRKRTGGSGMTGIREQLEYQGNRYMNMHKSRIGVARVTVNSTYGLCYKLDKLDT